MRHRFRAGMGLQHNVGFARDRAVRHVDDRDHVLTSIAGKAQGSQGVGGFARLRDEQGGPVFRQRRRAIAELRRDIDLDRNPRDGFKPVFRDHGRVKRGAARHHGQPGQVTRVERQRRG